MNITSLKLSQFRNYESLSVSFHPGTNVFYGDNAQGKTNILEAICLCSTSKSHRGSKDGEMIRFGADEAHIRMHLNRMETARRIDMHLRKGKAKGAAIDGLPIRRASELLGLINIVFFSPEDLGIVKNGPRERRRFLDMLISQTDPFYLHQLTSYQKVLAQRNKLLKELHADRKLYSTLDVWDEQLVRYGSYLIAAREKLLKKLDLIAGENHGKLTGGAETIHLQYEPDTEVEVFASRLAEVRERDLKFRMSTAGPHRDDFRVMTDDIDIRKFGSQGQQRSAALSLKLSEITLIREQSKEMPVLLLDDVLSELDSNRQNYLLRGIGSVQTFITCTGMDDLVEHHFPVDKAFHVEAGTIIEEKDPV